MGVQLTEIIEGEKHSQIVWNGRTISFAYDPNKYTAQAELEWQRIASSGGWVGEQAVAFIHKLLISWDLQGDVEWDYRDPTDAELEDDPEAQPIPLLTTGRVVPADHTFPLEVMKLRYVPMEIIGEIVDRIQRDVEVGKAKRQRSGGGSDTAGTRTLRRVT